MRPDLDRTQLDRYSRHIILNGVGPEGQAALLDSSVLVVGAGGLGSPIVQYLAAAGVGRLGIADDDRVERSNLQRQVVHRDADVGRPKVESAAEFVAELNPDVTVETHDLRVSPDNVMALIEGYDVVVDATDNFPTRYLLNDACVLTGTPLSHGAVYRFEGQVTTFEREGDSPCYRCLFPEAPPEGAVPDCATAGVLGVVPGLIGTVQATEVIKLLIGYGETLDGRLWNVDAGGMDVETVPIRPNPDCPVCGDDPAITSLEDVEYADRCRIPSG
ncbi:Dinucleotide-utilizing enzyme involved in molybdopterin and thiamine biosynthesis [Halapricum desulfuricans]|uniref:Dinucleotide-utilizing enzyme involved in molybdopterin and thiamine biosynthesis n=1 Tax=Halapricum desulfuricans TaxID=2841257 RepID=A0A897NJN6_9EURY|nr:molybdopterin-synthase adenylyltransferase MoeB [Halapricum desulfuricans]QSG11163.1 Dinucleotide-utilizing enzyme involved in molybdopterin and thiamine biosynthesis [Halapricum desulfuricans]